MKVCVFIDGKNWYSGWKDCASQYIIDFEKLTDWLVTKVNGTSFWGAYYYTAVEVGAESQTDAQRKLSAFLDEREMNKGFFVKRFPRSSRRSVCQGCGKSEHVTFEKEVDTSIVTDMLKLAAIDSYDIAVLISGDGDYTPAVRAVRELGKKVIIATWNGYGLSPRIRREAFDHIDLLTGLSAFGTLSARESEAPAEATPLPSGLSPEETVFLDEIKRAADKIPYVGLSFFLTKWMSPRMPFGSFDRRRVMDSLVARGLFTICEIDGSKEIKVS